MLIALITFIFTIAAVAFGWYLRKWSHQPLHPHAPGDQVCGICGRDLPEGTLRTHHGQWRCVEHKSS